MSWARLVGWRAIFFGADYGSKVAGTVYFKVDGRRKLTVTGEAEAPVGDVTRGHHRAGLLLGGRPRSVSQGVRSAYARFPAG
ncbi:phage tail tube protein [Paracandidimonas soli]|uniref:phage tail tube protein n=1 Tax=Paracandidimonas soli TaxID=1917182 RepID=UPI00360871B9